MALLGQTAPPPATETFIYSPPGGETGTIKIFVANRVASPARVRVILRPGAGPTVVEDFLAFDESIPGNEGRKSVVFDVENPEEVLVQTDITGVSFQVNGIERATI